MPTLAVSKADLFYDVEGAGAPIAFLNGIAMTTQSWTPYLERFRREGYRCVLHDFRGQLRSEKPEEAYSLEQHADDFVALLDALGIETCHLVGTSYGGEVGVHVAAAYPERVQTLSLIACAPRPGLLERVTAAVWSGTAFNDGVVRAWIPSFPSLTRFSWQLGAPSQELPQAYFSGLLRLIRASMQRDLTEHLERITVPALVLCGALDGLKPVSASTELAERLPDAELHVVPGAGHTVVLEQPAAVYAALAPFIARHPIPASASAEA